MKKRERINVVGKDEYLSNNPFDDLDLSKIKLLKKEIQDQVINENEINISESKKGRVDIRREKAGRGGKIVTVLSGIQNSQERKALLKMLQRQGACGGTIKNESIEIQGDKRDEIARQLRENGYRVVFIGG